MAKRKPSKPNKEYVGPTQVGACDTLVLGMDPGSRNFGIALVGLSRNKIKVFATSVLTTPIDDLVDFESATTPFLKEMKRWTKFGPDYMVAERFQTRGNGGPLIEKVSAMIGMLKGAYPKTFMKLTIASTWKNRFNRRHELDLKEVYPEVLVQPHQLDAALLGIYGLEECLGRTVDYDLENIFKQVESTSLIGLRKTK